jgi:hypothetical protein
MYIGNFFAQNNAFIPDFNCFVLHLDQDPGFGFQIRIHKVIESRSAIWIHKPAFHRY